MRSLLILDLNGCLVHSSFHKNVKSAAPQFKARSKWVWIRPFFHEFMSFILQHFDVAIWTSNIRENAESIVRSLFTEDEFRQIKFVFSRDQCYVSKDYSSIKDLSLVWRMYPDYDKNNTYIVDDDSEKILAAQRQNHIPILRYDPSDPNDRGLPDLMHALRQKFSVI